MAGWPVGPYFLQSPSRDVRIGTAEREQAVQLLSEHLSAGRLELAEFEERVAGAYAARTNYQLAALFRDLPGPLPPMAGYPSAPRRLPRRTILVLLVILALVVLVADVAFPPLFLIPICLLVIHRRRRLWAMAGGRRP